MARKNFWKSVSGLELERGYVANEGLAEHVPAGSAIYAWRRRFRAPLNASTNPVALAQWVETIVKIPSAILPQRELSHFLLLHGISIGGGPLTEDKLQTLRDWTADAKSRAWLIELVESIARLTPPLYVGETDHLPRRVCDHLGYKTDFSLTLRDKLNLSWEECDLWYCSIPPEMLPSGGGVAKSRRTLIELLVARLAIAGSTTRPG